MNFLSIPIWVTVLAVAAQYYLVRRPQRWLGFFIPLLYLALSVITAVQVLQSGDTSFGSVTVTALVAFLMGNMNTVLLLVEYAMRDSDFPSTLIAMFLSYIAMTLLFAVISAVFLYVFGGTF